MLFKNTTLSLFAALALAAKAANAVDITVDKWVLPWEGPKELEAAVGDVITFNWAGGHNVYIHPTGDCSLDGAILVGTQTGASYTFVDADAGTSMFFSCDIGNGAHCRVGQSLVVAVSGDEDPDGEVEVTEEIVDEEAGAEVTEDEGAEVVDETGDVAMDETNDAATMDEEPTDVAMDDEPSGAATFVAAKAMTGTIAAAVVLALV